MHTVKISAEHIASTDVEVSPRPRDERKVRVFAHERFNGKSSFIRAKMEKGIRASFFQIILNTKSAVNKRFAVYNLFKGTSKIAASVSPTELLKSFHFF